MVDKDIVSINILVITKIRELILNNNRGDALLYFGITEPLADYLEGCTLAQIEDLSKCGVFCFSPRFNEDMVTYLSAENAKSIYNSRLILGTASRELAHG